MKRKKAKRKKLRKVRINENTYSEQLTMPNERFR